MRGEAARHLFRGRIVALNKTSSGCEAM